MVGRTYERQSLVVRTNLPFENWAEVLEERHIKERIESFCQKAKSLGGTSCLPKGRMHRKAVLSGPDD